jgi:MFS family permease
VEDYHRDGTETGREKKRTGFLGRFQSDRDYKLYLMAGLCAGVAGGINSSIFNNYLSNFFLKDPLTSEKMRGFLEVPRELPGFLIMLILALLNFLGDVRIAMFGMIGAGLGLFGLGLLTPTYSVLLIWMMMFSLGTHMIMPVSPSIGMSLSKREEYGARLGRTSAYGLYGMIAAYIFVFIVFGFATDSSKYSNRLTYQIAFIIASVFYAFAAILIGMMKKGKPQTRKIRFVFRKKYTLYYVLAIISGARNQIFMTFAPWVLIKVFNLGPQMFAILGLVVAFVSIGTRKLVGRLIDSRGERFVLTIEAVFLFVICIGYAGSAEVFPSAVAVVIIAACYVIDLSTSVVEMARSTYVRKIAIDPADVTPTLSTGTSLQHIASMLIPVFGGLLWAAVGYQWVFVGAAVIALLNLILSRGIRIDNVPAEQSAE